MSNFKRFIYGTDNHKLETEMNIEIDDHKIALLVNAITAELKPFTKTQSLRARVSGIVLEHLKPNIFNPEERDFLRNATFPQLEERYGPLETWRPPNEPLAPPVEDGATEPTNLPPVVTKDPFPLQTGTKLKTL
tara:strand:- start:2168 stop:2569 length:402 start_codon:yes stop_codon:yes gene_type:complete